MQGVQGSFMHQRGLAGQAVLAILAASLAIGVAFGGGEPRAVAANENWRVAEPVTYENLSVFPVMSRGAADTSGFVTLDEALASGDAVVTEQGAQAMRRSRGGTPEFQNVPFEEGGGARVNQLVLVNRGNKPLVLLAGEVISGGKQDRIIGKDRIVPVGAEPLPLEVFCVEHGRWTTASDKFAAAKMMAHPSVREKAAVSQSQSEVWAAVRSGTTAEPSVAAGIAGASPALTTADLAALEHTEAPTGSYVKMYGSRQVSGSVENFAQEIEKRFSKATANLKGERVVGVVVAYGGEVAWSDVFASTQLFDRYWPKLVRSYVVEALARPQLRERASLDDAREFLSRTGGRERIESEPGVYRCVERTEGRYAEIELEALAPKTMTLHWLKVLRTN